MSPLGVHQLNNGTGKEESKGQETADQAEETLPLRPLQILEDTRTGDYDCGLGSWKPRWLQKYATSKSFLFVYGMLGTVQAMSFVYFLGTLTTIERRFGIQSKTTGWMLSGNEVSQILLSPFLSFYGGRRNRPLWIAWGVVFSALSCYVLASPHFIFGGGEAALAYTVEYGLLHDSSNHSLAERRDKAALCTREEKVAGSCALGEDTSSTFTPLLIFASQFILGIGTTLYYSLGQPYIDDNSKKSNTPFLLGLTMALRTIGPSFGFLMTFLCLNQYIDPTLTPTINSKDPRWLGAWWLGWVILGSVMLLQGAMISLFPKKLRKAGQSVGGAEEVVDKLQKEKTLDSCKELEAAPIQPSSTPPTKDFISSLKKLLRNKLLIINIFSGVFYVLGGSGYMTFMTRNMEVQWYQSSARANIIIGPIVLGAMVAGFIVSGYVISKCKPRPTILLGWNVFVGACYILSEIIFIFLACPEVEIVGYNTQSKSLNFLNECNSGCGCEGVNFAPVCLKESGLTFFSPCHAGCSVITTSGLTTGYANCSCIPAKTGVSIPGIPGEDYSSYQYETYEGTVNNGYCLPDCQKAKTIYFILSCLMHFLGSSGKIGNILVNYRAVDPDEKSFSTGLGLFLISLMAFIPGPVIFGYILDETCLVWNNTCGREGSCSFYDRDKFRLYLNGTAAVITLLGVVLDAVVCYLGRNLQLYDEPQTPAQVTSNKHDG